MKKNCLFVFDHSTDQHHQVLSKLDEFFGQLGETHYVYVADSEQKDVEDSPGGARFLPWSDRVIDSFGELEIIVVADNPGLFRELKAKVPAKTQVVALNLENGCDRRIREFSEHFLSTLFSHPRKTTRRAA